MRPARWAIWTNLYNRFHCRWNRDKFWYIVWKKYKIFLSTYWAYSEVLSADHLPFGVHKLVKYENICVLHLKYRIMLSASKPTPQNYRWQNGKVQFLIRLHLKVALPRRIEESSSRREERNTKTKISQPLYVGVKWGGGPVQPWRILRANEDCTVFVFRVHYCFPFCHL